MICWVLVEQGLKGTENQCLGVTDALGIVPVVKNISLKQPWKALSPYISARILDGVEGDELKAPWPDLLIAGGRKAVGVALAIKKASGGKTFTVMLQDPRVRHKEFDLVALPAHDPGRGDNIVVTTAAPNRITRRRLFTASAKFSPSLYHLPHPRVAVLIGGTSKAHRMTATITGEFGNVLKKLAREGAGLMVTTSRRTGEDNRAILEAWLSTTGAYVWNGKSDNPYEGFLALADYILVTEDSVSMTSEAASTGKPVYRISLTGGSQRLDKFHQLLEEKGIVRPFAGKLEKWTYQPLNDAGLVAERIRKELQLKTVESAA